MATQHVYRISTSLEEDRPEIDFELSENSDCVDWIQTREILDGSLDVTHYRSPHLIVAASDATEWDFYRCGGTLGVLSKRAVDILRPYGTRCFDYLEAFINDRPFFLVREIGTIDCLDRKSTIGKMFPHDSSRFMRIDQYSFHKSRLVDPSIFVTPEDNTRIFGTDSVNRLIEQHGLRGFRLVDAEKEPVNS
jgi:hypothetical protein